MLTLIRTQLKLIHKRYTYTYSNGIAHPDGSIIMLVSDLKCLNAFKPATSHTARTLDALNYPATVKEFDLDFFLHYCTLFVRVGT